MPARGRDSGVDAALVLAVASDKFRSKYDELVARKEAAERAEDAAQEAVADLGAKQEKADADKRALAAEKRAHAAQVERDAKDRDAAWARVSAGQSANEAEKLRLSGKADDIAARETGVTEKEARLNQRYNDLEIAASNLGANKAALDVERADFEDEVEQFRGYVERVKGAIKDVEAF